MVESTLTPILDEDCITCPEHQAYLDQGEVSPYPLNECPESKRSCGHHCNCSWVYDHCHWCDKEFGEEE